MKKRMLMITLLMVSASYARHDDNSHNNLHDHVHHVGNAARDAGVEAVNHAQDVAVQELHNRLDKLEAGLPAMIEKIVTRLLDGMMSGVESVYSGARNRAVGAWNWMRGNKTQTVSGHAEIPATK